MELTKDKKLFRQLWLSLSVFEVISTFSYQISAVTKYKKLILFIDLDAEFHVRKLSLGDFLPKIIRKAGNCECLILHVKFICPKYGGTHSRLLKSSQILFGLTVVR